MLYSPSKILIDGSKFGLDWLQIHWYGFFIAVGIVLSVLLASYEAKRRKFPQDTVIDMCLICLPLGIICARLYYVIFQWSEFYTPGASFWDVLYNIIAVWNGGLAIYGAIIGGFAGIAIYARRKRMRFLSLVDLAVPGVALAQALGRWGNFFNQEAYGNVIPDTFPRIWPLVVKIDECRQPCCEGLPTNLGNLHYATFFYESMWCLIIFAVLWFLVRKAAKHRGDCFFVYCLMYGFERMLVEGLRTDSLMIGSFRVSQLLSGILFIGALLFIVIREIYERKTNRIIWPNDSIFCGESDSEPIEGEGSDVPTEASENGEYSADYIDSVDDSKITTSTEDLDVEK